MANTSHFRFDYDDKMKYEHYQNYQRRDGTDDSTGSMYCINDNGEMGLDNSFSQLTFCIMMRCIVLLDKNLAKYNM